MANAWSNLRDHLADWWALSTLRAANAAARGNRFHSGYARLLGSLCNRLSAEPQACTLPLAGHPDGSKIPV